MSVCYSICQQPLGSRGPRSQNSPVFCFYGASVHRFDSFTFSSPLAKQSHVLTSCIYLILCSYKLLLDDLRQAVLFFAQSDNSVCKVGNKIRNKKPMSQMKEHTCYALITAPTLRTSAPLNQQPEVEAWLSEYTQALVALRAETFTFV